MNTAQQIESAAKFLEGLCAARDNLDSVLSSLVETNALVALDPSGEPEELQAVIDALAKAKGTLSLEVYRWDTYLDNRE
jgi:hypothetical protein